MNEPKKRGPASGTPSIIELTKDQLFELLPFAAEEIPVRRKWVEAATLKKYQNNTSKTEEPSEVVVEKLDLTDV